MRELLLNFMLKNIKSYGGEIFTSILYLTRKLYNINIF